MVTNCHLNIIFCHHVIHEIFIVGIIYFRFEVRVVVYNVLGVPLQETNIAGEKMSDVYVKGWLQGTDHVLKTDVHYRSVLKQMKE